MNRCALYIQLALSVSLNIGCQRTDRPPPTTTTQAEKPSTANLLKRYLLNSNALKSYKYGPDSSLTLYLSHDSPGPMNQANCLPPPNGPFYAILRVYLPEESVLSGTWKRPQLPPLAAK